MIGWYDFCYIFNKTLYNSIIQYMDSKSLIIICDENNRTDENLRKTIEQFNTYLLSENIDIEENKYYFDVTNAAQRKRIPYGSIHNTNHIILKKQTAIGNFPLDKEGYDIMGSCTGLQNIMVVK